VFSWAGVIYIYVCIQTCIHANIHMCIHHLGGVAFWVKAIGVRECFSGLGLRSKNTRGRYIDLRYDRFTFKV